MPDLESVYAVIADVKGRNADNFVVRKFRKKISKIRIFALQAQKTLKTEYCSVIW